LGFAIIHVFLDLHNVPDWAISFLTGQNTTRHACARCLGFPTVFSSRGPEAACSRLLGDVVVFLHTYLQSQDSRKLSCWMDTGGPRRGLAKQGKVVLRFFSCESDFFMRSFLPFVLFQVSWPSAAVQRSKNMCLSVRGAGSPVLASLLGILFQRQRPQQWLRNTKVSFASGQL
jgi:hypothetical protein